MLTASDWEARVYACTLLAIAFAILFQIILRLRVRIQILEADAQAFGDAKEKLKEDIETLREEMRSVREVDREEKLCLVETVKQVLRQSNGMPTEDHMVDEAYSNRQLQEPPTVDDNDDLDMQNDGSETLVEEDTSCPWCSHAHLLRLGGCAGDDTCDGSVHIPYCPSCFYNEGKRHGQEAIGLESTSRDEESPAASGGLDDGEADSKPF
ncbi:hypothetical protein BKA65DRAFT_487639 [Rhexocercosporidium sp. MPI-PUGE-AT-0058]|nr:hypothetical protein BKA65DRAFT_487639 [Rhexocercosporidium sp. MPI-PUGE-AT-0058]